MSKETEVLTENKMGVMPIRPLLIQIALPIVFSMLVGALYNIIDSIFVAKISEEAFNALSLVFPFQNLMIAVGVGTGVGVNALLSKSLGEKNFEMANKVASNGVFLGLLSYIVFAILSLFGARAFLSIQTDNAEIIASGVTYIQIVGICSFGLMAQLIFEKLLQSTGNTAYILLTQGLGAVINIILDPILIFGLLGFPKMGVAGAAWATVIGQVVGGIVAILINEHKNKEIKLEVKGFRPEGAVIKEIYKVGVPSIIMSSISSVMVFLFNQILLMYSEASVAILGVYFKLQSFIFMPVFGFTNGMIPIVAYNYGAKKKSRLISAHKNCVGFAMIIMVIGLVIFQLGATQILNLFSLPQETVALGIKALRIISWNFIFAGFNIVGSSLFQALGNGVLSMFMSIARQLVVLIPTAYLLAKVGGVDAVWWSFPIAELFAFVMCTYFVMRIYKNKIDLMPDDIPVKQKA